MTPIRRLAMLALGLTYVHSVFGAIVRITGSAAIGRDVQNQTYRAGGYGPLSSDEGSAFRRSRLTDFPLPVAIPTGIPFSRRAARPFAISTPAPTKRSFASQSVPS